MAVGYSFKKLLLRGLIWDAEENVMTIQAVLKDSIRAKITSISGGLYLISTSANGASVTYQLPALASGISPDRIATACSELYDLYEAAIVDLSGDSIASPTNEQIRDRMLAMMLPTNQARSDYSLMTTT